MSHKLRRWQTRIWIGEKADQPVTAYGESINELREVVKIWLESNKPEAFGNASPDYELTRRINYSYSDGTKVPLFPLHSNEPLKEGWHYIKGTFSLSRPTYCENFDKVISHFVNEAMIVEKGPDYKDIALVEGKLELHLIKRIRRESEEFTVNDMLQRGWYIIATEYQGKEDYFGEKIVSRQIIFVLGHTDEDAL